MNDRELLEMAARAVGIEIGFDEFRCQFRTKMAMGFLGENWNPLADDGDAFRLAIKLDIEIELNSEIETVGVMWVDRRGNPGNLKDILCICYTGIDKARCVRRAIVRAAAEIGRSKILVTYQA